MHLKNSNSEKREILRFLKHIGVDTRFTSVFPHHIYINNLRFSKFSRKREELFKKNYPEIDVIRSTIFQKICMRSSKILGESLQPREKILINPSDDPYTKALSVILEPYSRKYGIEIIKTEFNLKNLEQIDADAVALPLTLDHEVTAVLGRIFNGKRIDLLSSQNKKREVKLIYPLINVPMDWIHAWLKIEDGCEVGNELSNEFLVFLEDIVPQVRENIFKASTFLIKKM